MCTQITVGLIAYNLIPEVMMNSTFLNLFIVITTMISIYKYI